MSGEDPDFAKRDLWQTIEKGESPTWTMKVQIMQADPEKWVLILSMLPKFGLGHSSR
jgi:catalase